MDENLQIDSTLDRVKKFNIHEDDKCDSISFLITSQPYDRFHATNKEYVDTLVQDIKWERAIIKFYDPKLSLPKNPENGDRYISLGTANGWAINKIYHYNGYEWIETVPNKGYTVWAQCEKETSFIYNGITWEKFGKSIDHNDIKNNGKMTHQMIDAHIKNDRLHCKEKHISHNNIKDVGMYTHQSIDSHILNSSTAHFGQDLTKTGQPTFKSLNINETTMASHVASKNYVDMMTLGLKWISSTKSFHDPIINLPEECVIGDKYISMATANGWEENNIYEYAYEEKELNPQWKEIIPINGTATYIEGGVVYANDNVLYNGIKWIKFGTTQNHDSLTNSGIKTHQEIDAHIDNITAHFGQDLTVNGMPTFTNLQITDKIISTEQISERHITEHFQIGKVEAPEKLREMSSCIITGNNDPVVLTRVYSDASSIEPIKDIYMRSRGDIYTPTEILNGTSIGASIYAGHDGQKYNVTSTIECVATEDFNSTSHGSAINFGTTQNATTEPVINMTIDHDGTINCHSNKECNSLSEGALVVNGGVGIAKELHIGGIMRNHNDIYFNSFDEVSSILNETYENFDKKIINICGGGGVSNIRGSKITVSGVDSIMNGKIQINAGLPYGNIEMLTGNMERLIITNTGNCQITNDDDSNSASTGSVVLNGGLGIQKNLYVGGSQIILDKTNQPSIHPDSNLLQDTAQLTICGGGIADHERGGFICLSGNNHKNHGSIYLTSGDNKGNIYFSSGEKSETNCTIDSAGLWKFHSKINSTSQTTGSVIINGGLGVNQTINANEIKCSQALQMPCFENDPINGVIGMMYFNTTDNVMRIYSNNGWRSIQYM